MRAHSNIHSTNVCWAIFMLLLSSMVKSAASMRSLSVQLMGTNKLAQHKNQSIFKRPSNEINKVAVLLPMYSYLKSHSSFYERWGMPPLVKLPVHLVRDFHRLYERSVQSLYIFLFTFLSLVSSSNNIHITVFGQVNNRYTTTSKWDCGSVFRSACARFIIYVKLRPIKFHSLWFQSTLCASIHWEYFDQNPIVW